MMVRSTLLALAAPLALTAAMFSPGTAEAANRFAVTGIENNSTHTITYSYHWGDGAWKTVTLKPGTRELHWWTYSKANENHSPELHVKFDSEFDPQQKPFFITYKLKRSAAPAHDWEDAHKYTFKNDGNKFFVDLYEKK
jgi:hypothetical protein